MDFLNRIIDFSLHNRVLVILSVMAAGVAGVFALQHLDIDAFPDTTPVQVQINTVVPALSPEEVERQITFPIEQAISGLPGLEQMRSISKFGMSQVVVIFEDGIDIYFARQLINERLVSVEMPQGIERPKMGPVATGLGEVFHYIVTGQKLWTTYAQWADWLFCLVRTGQDTRPQSGISFLLIDMRSPGVTVWRNFTLSMPRKYSRLLLVSKGSDA